VDKALIVEHKCRELEERKRKFNSPWQSSSNTRPRVSMPQGPQQRLGMQHG
jgi:hypothetical protein